VVGSHDLFARTIENVEDDPMEASGIHTNVSLPHNRFLAGVDILDMMECWMARYRISW